MRSASVAFAVAQAAGAAARAIVLAALPDPLAPGDPLPVSAAITGPIARVQFTLRNSGGALVQPAQTVTVAAGRASATFTAPATGGGYRVRAANADDLSLSTVSPPFAVGAPPALLLEAADGGTAQRLLAEQGGALLL